MQAIIKGFSILLIVLTMILVSGQAIAQSDQGTSAREFGLGQPQSTKDLPPGQLRNRLESLPPQASSKALRWLHPHACRHRFYWDRQLHLISRAPGGRDGGTNGVASGRLQPNSLK